MQHNKQAHRAVLRLTVLALLTALVFLLQLLGSFIRFGPFSVSLVLLPIVVGAAFCGPLAGGWLGLVFAAAVFVSGDASAFLAVHPLGTVVTVLLKGFLCGLAAGGVYRLLARRSRRTAVVCAALTCPVVNTATFLLGCLVFFLPALRQWALAEGFATVGAYILVGLVGLNFVFEVLFNLFLSPILLRVLEASGLSRREEQA